MPSAFYLLRAYTGSDSLELVRSCLCDTSALFAVGEHVFVVMFMCRSSMEESIRRRAPDERRIRARAAKLMDRELQYAARMGSRTILCPCTIHGRETRSGLVPRSYQRCLRENGRHAWFFGRSEVGCKTWTVSLIPLLSAVFANLLAVHTIFSLQCLLAGIHRRPLSVHTEFFFLSSPLCSGVIGSRIGTFRRS